MELFKKFLFFLCGGLALLEEVKKYRFVFAVDEETDLHELIFYRDLLDKLILKRLGVYNAEKTKQGNRRK